MLRKIIPFIVFVLLLKQGAAQQNWAGVPCYHPKIVNDEVYNMFLDSLHNQIILNSVYGYSACSTKYKGVFAYDGVNFRDLDYGLDAYNPNPSAGGDMTLDCITYGNKTLFGGAFASVGSNTLYAEAIALWNGAVWDTFPKRCFRSNPARNGNGAGINGFTKANGKLWIYGGFDTIGAVITKNIATFDGNNFGVVPSIPSDYDWYVTKILPYKNKLYAIGNFITYTSTPAFKQVAMYDGTSWAPVGNGINGGLNSPRNMIIYNDTLYIAGTWGAGGGNVGNYIMKWDGTQLRDAGFTSPYFGYYGISGLAVHRNRLYVSGAFKSPTGNSGFGIAYYQNGQWTTPNDSILGMGTLLVFNNELYGAGNFKQIKGDTNIRNFAKLLCPDFDAATGCLSGLIENRYKLEVKVFPNPSNGIINIEFEQNVSIDKLGITNTLGQQVYTILTPEPKQEIDISHLSPGIYFLKAENRQGQGVFKLIKE